MRRSRRPSPPHRNAFGLVNAVLRKVSAAVTEGVSFPSVGTELSYPDWIVTRLGADLGEERARAALETMNVAAEVHIRDDGYVQDPSSQAVAAAVPVSTGDVVLDACAAPGGKATAIAGTGARVIGADSRHSRAGLIVANRRRSISTIFTSCRPTVLRRRTPTPRSMRYSSTPRAAGSGRCVAVPTPAGGSGPAMSMNSPSCSSGSCSPRRRL